MTKESGEGEKPRRRQAALDLGKWSRNIPTCRLPRAELKEGAAAPDAHDSPPEDEMRCLSLGRWNSGSS